MTLKDNSYQLIESQEDIDKFLLENQNINWLGFDTEFIGEKRFYTLLCLVQISTENGYYLIDTLKVKDISKVLDLFTDSSILKITHAGENDYRIFFQQFGIVPLNVFDTQIAAGFIGYKYPTSFQKLVDKELGFFVPKGYTVSDWQARPFTSKQIKYALNDVIHLYDLYEKINAKLVSMERVEWANEECQKLSSPEFYQPNPNKDAFSNNALPRLNPQSQIFMIRLYRWRIQEAEKRNYSKEMILPNKFITTVVRNMTQGKNALLKDRRLPSNTISKHWHIFNDLYNQPISDIDKIILSQIPIQLESPEAKQNTMLEMLYSVVEYICHDNQVDPSLILSRSSFKKMKSDPDFFEESIAQGWKAKLLGEDLLKWLRVRKDLVIEMKDGNCVIRMEN